MRVNAFEQLISREAAARRLVRWLRDKKGRRFCPGCQGRVIYRLTEGRFRCGRCRYPLGALTGTWLGQSRVALSTWLWLIKLFELAGTARQAAIQVGVSYPTALRAFTTLRRAILAQEAPGLLRREVEADESDVGGVRTGNRGAAGKIPVFGILERQGRVSVTVVPNVTSKTLLEETVQMVKRGTLVYTDKWQASDALTCCGYRHLKVDHGRRLSRGKVPSNGLEGVWSYAKGKRLQQHGVSPHRFPLYLSEMQVRYNHRRQDLVHLILHAAVQPVPDLL